MDEKLHDGNDGDDEGEDFRGVAKVRREVQGCPATAGAAGEVVKIRAVTSCRK